MRLPEALVEDLEILAMEAQRGEAVGPGLTRRLERDMTVAFARHGFPDARVQARAERGGVVVRVDLPRPGRPVERVVFSLGGL